MTENIITIINYINGIILDHYLYSFCIYFLISIIFFTFSLPGGLIILLGSGFFFGLIQGFIINIISISLGSLFFIYFSKSLLSKIFDKLYNKFSYKITEYIKDSSYEYLILMRLIIGPPLVFQNLCIAMMDITKRKIFLSSIIGFTPLILFISYIGNFTSSLIDLKSYTFSDIFSYEIFIIFSIFIILIFIRIFFKK